MVHRLPNPRFFSSKPRRAAKSKQQKNAAAAATGPRPAPVPMAAKISPAKLKQMNAAASAARPAPAKVSAPERLKQQMNSAAAAAGARQASAQEVVPPIPRRIFPRYSPTTSTPLPPPAMPRKPLLRRLLPFLVAASVGGAYILLRSSNEVSSRVAEDVTTETASAPFVNTEDATAEGTVQ